MRLTPEQVLEKLGSGNGNYDDGDIPGWLSIDTNGIVIWEEDPEEGEVKVTQRFQVTVVEIEGEGS